LARPWLAWLNFAELGVSAEMCQDDAENVPRTAWLAFGGKNIFYFVVNLLLHPLLFYATILTLPAEKVLAEPLKERNNL
jgi:hypothetical protein